MREWRLRTKLTAVLVVPLMLAGVLGTLRVTDLARSAQDFAALSRQVGLVQQLDLVVHNLQGERRWVTAMLVTAAPTEHAVLRGRVQIQAQRVDAAAARLRDTGIATESVGPIAARTPPIVSEAYRVAVDRLSGLAALRQATFGPTATVGESGAFSAVAAYSSFIAVLLDLESRLLDGALIPVAHEMVGVKALSVAQEQASLQHTVLLTGISSGGLAPAQQAALRTAEARFDAAADEFGQATSPAQRRLYFNSVAAIDRKRLLVAALDRAVRAMPLETVSGDWNSAAAGTVVTMHQGVDTLLGELRTDAQVRSAQAWREAFWDGAEVAALLLLAVVPLFVVVRSLLQPLRTLRTAAFEVADRRLPQAVEQVVATDGTPDAATVDPVPVHSREEVGQVARAFDTVHAQAVRLAAKQAQLRNSLNDAFLNLSGRSQRLVGQQLRLIEKLRSTAHDPEVASGLVQLDRLAARMRRHSENLLILAGGAVPRSAEGSVAVSDVVSDAVAEIDEHQRVTARPLPVATVAGPVGGDLTHIMTELLDNAVSVTPPGGMVTVGCAFVEDKNLLVEIADAGPGLPAEELETINARLVSAPVPDSPVPGQMGLVVVRELAMRHGITVQLRQRLGNGGITATVLLPASLLTVESEPEQPWRGVEEQLPLQISVVDQNNETDLFSPSSLDLSSLRVLSSPPSHPRTAQEEWLELFGHHEPASEPFSDQVNVGQLDAGQLDADREEIPVACDPLWSPVLPGLDAQGGPSGEVREEIFEMVSAWFRERESALVSNPSCTISTEWQSPFDAGWRAAQALRTRVDHEFTAAGLPKRQPREHLVSGTEGRVSPTPLPAGPARTPEAVRGRLARYQRGLRVGRHARIGPDDEFTWPDSP